MCGAFTGGKTAIVTTDAGCHHTDVTEGDARPARRGMTHVTGLRRWKMGCGFADGDNAVMTRLTSAQHFGMIHRDYWCESSGVMAGVTDISGTNVRCTLTRGCRAIMTARTGALYLSVIHLGSRYPGSAGVTGLAHFGAGDVRCTFTNGGCTIMTSGASTVGLGVVHANHRGPHAGIVAGLADIRRVDVSRFFTRCGNTIVATGTAARHTGMIKHRANPGYGDVADVTSCGSRDMRRALAAGDNAIVTGLASAVDLCMIHRDHRRPT